MLYVASQSCDISPLLNDAYRMVENNRVGAFNPTDSEIAAYSLSNYVSYPISCGEFQFDVTI